MVSNFNNHHVNSIFIAGGNGGFPNSKSVFDILKNNGKSRLLLMFIPLLLLIFAFLVTNAFLKRQRIRTEALAIREQMKANQVSVEINFEPVYENEGQTMLGMCKVESLLSSNEEYSIFFDLMQSKEIFSKMQKLPHTVFVIPNSSFKYLSDEEKEAISRNPERNVALNPLLKELIDKPVDISINNLELMPRPVVTLYKEEGSFYGKSYKVRRDNGLFYFNELPIELGKEIPCADAVIIEANRVLL